MRVGSGVAPRAPPPNGQKANRLTNTTLRPGEPNLPQYNFDAWSGKG